MAAVRRHATRERARTAIDHGASRRLAMRRRYVRGIAENRHPAYSEGMTELREETSKVLIADDNADVREALSVFVACIGKEPLGAADGAEALVVARREHPRLIVLDLMMPNMDGWAFGRALQHDPALSSIPFIVLSAQVETGCAETMGAAAALRKPPDLGHLGRLITELCGPTEPYSGG